MELDGRLTILFSYLLIMISYLQVTDAAAAVSFQFRQKYSSIQSDVDSFASQLTTDLRTKYNYTSSHISAVQVSSGDNGNIQIYFDLDIDTRDAVELANRNRLQNDLSNELYIFLYTNMTGARAAFLVDGASASVTPTFWDGWHQNGPEILFAVLGGFFGIALFCVTIYCLISRHHGRKRWATRSSRNGLDNPAFATEMSDMSSMYKTQNMEVTPIPQRASPSMLEPIPSLSEALHNITRPTTDINISSSSVATHQTSASQTKSTGPVEPRVSRLVTTPDGVAAFKANSVSSSAPSNGRQRPRPALLTSATRHGEGSPAESWSKSWSKSSHLKQPKSPRAAPKGSTRSWTSILGGASSNQSTPSSSRRPSRVEPTIYERLLYANYSVPPRKSFQFI